MAESSGFKVSPVWIGAFAGVVLLALGQVFTLVKLRAVETKLADVQAGQSKTKGTLDTEVARMRDAVAAADAQRDKALEAVRHQVDETQQQARGLAGQVREEARKRTEALNVRLNANEREIRDNHAQISGELDGVKQTATSANTSIAAVSNEVSLVKSDVAATKSQLDSTIADLRRVTGDMGVMSGLIATNEKEIDALRQLGDRNYSEFTVAKTKDPVRVADVWVQLRKVDEGRNRYTIMLRADDRKIEKKDRTVNEPIQFYVGRNRQPYELVVNRVQKNQIVGYLATPKVTATR
jgi:chromosome segregation ATPase